MPGPGPLEEVHHARTEVPTASEQERRRKSAGHPLSQVGPRFVALEPPRELLPPSLDFGSCLGREQSREMKGTRRRRSPHPFIRIDVREAVKAPFGRHRARHRTCGPQDHLRPLEQDESRFHPRAVHRARAGRGASAPGRAQANQGARSSDSSRRGALRTLAQGSILALRMAAGPGWADRARSARAPARATKAAIATGVPSEAARCLNAGTTNASPRTPPARMADPAPAMVPESVPPARAMATGD